MCGDEAKYRNTAACTLTIEAGRLHIRLQDAQEAIPTSIVYLRPLSARSEISFFNDESQEILTLGSLEELAPACQEIAKAELAERYHLPQITHVKSIETIFGSHYWKVATDKGNCEFAFKEPGKNVTRINQEHVILCDTIGNRFEIRSLSELDSHSRRQVNRILYKFCSFSSC